MGLKNICCPLFLPEREERERLEQEQREEEEREYQEKLRKLEEQERKQRARQQEIEERERRREEERRAEEKTKVRMSFCNPDSLNVYPPGDPKFGLTTDALLPVIKFVLTRVFCSNRTGGAIVIVIVIGGAIGIVIVIVIAKREDGESVLKEATQNAVVLLLTGLCWTSRFFLFCFFIFN